MKRAFITLILTASSIFSTISPAPAYTALCAKSVSSGKMACIFQENGRLIYDFGNGEMRLPVRTVSRNGSVFTASNRTHTYIVDYNRLILTVKRGSRTIQTIRLTRNF